MATLILSRNLTFCHIIRATSVSVTKVARKCQVLTTLVGRRSNSNFTSHTPHRDNRHELRKSLHGGGHSSKRSVDKPRDTSENGAFSVIAYNLSDELKIDNIQKFLRNFDDYQIDYSLPEDIQEEAVMLRQRAIDSTRQISDIFLFREGSIVFWGVPYQDQRRILYGLSALKINPNSSELIQDEKEHMQFSLSDSLDKSRLTRDTIQIAAKQDEGSMKLDQFAFSHAVALSVKLGIWETILDDYIESVKWITDNMKEGKDIQLSKDQVFRKTGEILCLKHSINLRSDLLDLPDLYWDRETQEEMFSTMISYLNIRRRTNVMNEKLNNCCELTTLLASYMNDRHHIRLEWMIIVLIFVEILFEAVKFV